MTQTVLTPCPTCGKCFDFPLTGCITDVAKMLLANSDGNCPDCGTRVVVDSLPTDTLPHNALTEANSLEDVRRIPIVDLDLSSKSLALTESGDDSCQRCIASRRRGVCERLS
jgi:DNA-directed RNA polymerase subunit RPC12/RpoP